MLFSLKLTNEQSEAGVGLDVRKIPSGSAYKYAPKFNVPALVPGFEIDGCMILDYALKLDVGFERCSAGSTTKNIACSLKVRSLHLSATQWFFFIMFCLRCFQHVDEAVIIRILK